MNVYYSEIKVGFQHVFFFPPPFPKVICFIVQCCDVRSVRLQPERWKASWMCLFSETFLSISPPPFFFLFYKFLSGGVSLRSRAPFFFPFFSPFLKLQLCRVPENVSARCKTVIVLNHLSLGV